MGCGWFLYWLRDKAELGFILISFCYCPMRGLRLVADVKRHLALLLTVLTLGFLRLWFSMRYRDMRSHMVASRKAIRIVGALAVDSMVIILTRRKQGYQAEFTEVHGGGKGGREDRS